VASNPPRILPMEQPGSGKGGIRVIVTALTLSLAGFAAWQGNEGFTNIAVIPTKGDVPTIGHGSTHYEDGSRVRMGDTITRKRAAELARNLIGQDERQFAASLPGVRMTQGEYDVYLDFTGQYGIGDWRKSGMRRNLIAGRPLAACNALLEWKRAAGYDAARRGISGAGACGSGRRPAIINASAA
jgi:lysozyme